MAKAHTRGREVEGRGAACTARTRGGEREGGSGAMAAAAAWRLRAHGVVAREMTAGHWHIDGGGQGAATGGGRGRPRRELCRPEWPVAGVV